ncbi:hypothetical protein MBLNU457_6009t1 [Dothideomycetes sp. NU457]
MPYRLDFAENRRAGCKDKECKNANIKFEKGEFRYGSWVNIPKPGGGVNGSWSYKHWGCVTPKQIENLQSECEGDLTLIDGYDELDDNWKEKVSRAVEQGHVDDEDWKHDPELNRPGAKAKRTPKKKKDADEEDENAEEKPAKAAGKKRGRGKQAEGGDDEEEAAAPAPKRGKAQAKKTATEDGETDQPPAKKTRTRKPASKAVVDASDDGAEEEHVEPAPKKGRTKKSASAVTTDKDGEASEKPAPKKGGRKKKATTEEE